jgi:ribonuclease P protein component
MPKKNRLSGAEIRRIRSPRRVHGALFSLSVAPGELREARFACVVSKKVAAKAVVRNSIKRRCRDILSREMRELPAGSYILYAKKGAVTARYQDLSEDMSKLFKGFRGA